MPHRKSRKSCLVNLPVCRVRPPDWRPNGYSWNPKAIESHAAGNGFMHSKYSCFVVAFWLVILQCIFCEHSMLRNLLHTRGLEFPILIITKSNVSSARILLFFVFDPK